MIIEGYKNGLLNSLNLQQRFKHVGEDKTSNNSKVIRKHKPNNQS